jgi:uncharacterized protein
VAGELVESPRPCPRIAADVRRLLGGLDALGVSLILVEANHDRSLGRASRSTRSSAGPFPLPASCTVDGWTIEHGHQPMSGDRTISGHVQPCSGLRGSARPASWSARAEWLKIPLRGLVSRGDELLDFGPLPDLRRRLLRLAT